MSLIIVPKECVLHVSCDSAGLLLAGVCRVLRIALWLRSWTAMAMGSDSLADGRSGVDFNVKLQVPWNAPEAYVNFDSDVYELKTIPDVLGLSARWPGAAVVWVLLRHDSSSVRALVPDARVIDQGFHEITLVDMGDTSGPDVSIADLSLLRLQ